MKIPECEWVCNVWFHQVRSLVIDGLKCGLNVVNLQRCLMCESSFFMLVSKRSMCQAHKRLQAWSKVEILTMWSELEKKSSRWKIITDHESQLWLCFKDTNRARRFNLREQRKHANWSRVFHWWIFGVLRDWLYKRDTSLLALLSFLQ